MLQVTVHDSHHISTGLRQSCKNRCFLSEISGKKNACHIRIPLSCLLNFFPCPVAGTIVSKWSPWALVKYAFTNIVAFTTFPLQFVTITGAICFACSLVLMVYSLVQYFTGSAVEGYTTLLMVLLLVGSAMMISLGIIGYYISKIYEEVKRRPRYIISKVIKNGNIQD